MAAIKDLGIKDLYYTTNDGYVHERIENIDIGGVALHYCSSCENGIYDGEKYIENLDGEYRHYECFHGMRDLLEWLGFEIKTMYED